MKKQLVGIMMLLSLATLSFGQGTSEPFDIKKSSQELEIMKGILDTTLKFGQSDQNEQGGWRWSVSNLETFYLAGQGAVFVIPAYRYSSGMTVVTPSRVVATPFGDVTVGGQEAGRIVSGVGSGAGSGVGSGVGSGTGSVPALPAPAAPAPPAPPAPQTPPAPPAPPTPPAQASPPDRSQELLRFYAEDLRNRNEEVRKSLEQVRTRVEKNRETLEASRKKLVESIQQIKPNLIEALANYGDSLTIVKPEEYINLVLVTEDFGSGGRRADVISARKSWITDYKAGRLSMDGFKQKVLQYVQ